MRFMCIVNQTMGKLADRQIKAGRMIDNGGLSGPVRRADRRMIAFRGIGASMPHRTDFSAPKCPNVCRSGTEQRRRGWRGAFVCLNSAVPVLPPATP
jgi:hypothetical protein